MTIDAGFLAGREIFLVLRGRALALRGDVHIGEVAARGSSSIRVNHSISGEPIHVGRV